MLAGCIFGYLKCSDWPKCTGLYLKSLRDPKKNEVDSDTLGVLLGHRFQVLDQYWRKVVSPVIRDLKQHASKATVRPFTRSTYIVDKDESRQS